MSFRIEDVTGKFEELDYNYFGIKPDVAIGPTYGLSFNRENPIEVFVTISLADRQNNIAANFRAKSIHTFKNMTGKFSAEQAEFLVKIAITNTNGIFKDKIFKDSGGAEIQLLTPEEVINSLDPNSADGRFLN